MTVQEFKIALQAGQITTPTFVSIRRYRNKQGELSNYLINCGTNYQNAKEADLAFLQFVVSMWKPLLLLYANLTLL